MTYIKVIVLLSKMMKSLAAHQKSSAAHRLRSTALDDFVWPARKYVASLKSLAVEELVAALLNWFKNN